ncbi:MAG: response regulator transcription factor [Flavobacteriales bacterium]|nr:response regulator transcription factor [Flavobacteriales bacterium]
MNKHSVVIVDDEVDSQIILQNFLNEYCPQTRLIAIYSTVKDCIKNLLTSPPDILLLDINLTDGTGFDVLKEITQLSIKVIFITAHDQYALDAFKHKVNNYLLKPINPKHLQNAIEDIIKTIELEKKLNNIQLFEESSNVKKLGIPSKGTLQLKSLQDIIRCEANGNYTFIYINDKERIIVPKTIKVFEELLTNNGFIRIHQSHLINQKYLEEIRIKKNLIFLKNGVQLPISRKYKMIIIRSFKLKII